MKKISVLVAALMLSLTLVGCGKNKNNDNAANDKVNDNGALQEENNTSTNDVDQGAVNENRLEVADDVADRIAKLDDVESANVIVTNQNAYVAVVLHEGVEGTEQVEDKIADEARAANSDFINVYISMNPDFVQQTTEYGDKIRAGEPVEGLFEEFSDAVKRVFPDAH